MLNGIFFDGHSHNTLYKYNTPEQQK